MVFALLPSACARLPRAVFAVQVTLTPLPWPALPHLELPCPGLLKLPLDVVPGAATGQPCVRRRADPDPPLA
jgi:hypothetical protein